MADPASTARVTRVPGTAVSRLTITVSDGRGGAVRATGLGAWLARVAPRAARGELSIALVSDARIRALNKRFRRQDTSTDVLSFPATDGNNAAPTGKLPRPLARRAPRGSRLAPRDRDLGPRFLGDIVISTDTARRQARDARHSLAAELKVLALHGLLHLLGYDHDAADDLGRMARAERRLRAKGGLRRGLIEREAPLPTTAPAARASGRRTPGEHRS